LVEVKLAQDMEVHNTHIMCYRRTSSEARYDAMCSGKARLVRALIARFASEKNSAVHTVK